ncbi:MAG TPA: site-specific DNA-methyltransferase [Pyrinomonadaceae bacterium]|nr:site-specific DNA-methyltransferase [Pyrinomonadaceae bacterium]
MSPTKKKKSKPASRRRTPQKAAKKKVAPKRVAELAEPKKTEVKIAAAKGRPMLTWVGKHPLQRVTAFPAQLVEKFDPRGELRTDKDSGGLLFHGDNKEVLAYLLANGYRGKVNLIYIDPPFDSGADYVRKVTLRGVSGAVKIEGDSYTLGEQLQYTDIWANDSYLQFMYERILLLRELLADDGTLYFHCDQRRIHHIRCLMDEVFGSQGLIAEIAWQRSDSHNDATYFGIVHDTIIAYSKSDSPMFNRIFLPISQRTADNWYKHLEEGTGRRYNLGNLVSPHPRPNLTYPWKGIRPPAMGWRISKERMAELDAKGLLVIVGKGDSRTLKVKQYLDESKGRLLSTWWDDISQLRGYGSDDEKTDYPTQKPEKLLARILAVSSRPGDIVLDCFVGSGTTAAVAQKLRRRWIAADINKGAIQTTSKRLQTIIEDQIEAQENGSKQTKLIDNDKEETPKPAQLSFSVYRVNDYDLQIQHNEAVNLACEHIGIKRTKSDSFFEGELGKKLVKIVPFNHPLSPLDLEQIKSELAARPEEDRDVTVVSLGKELAVDAWLEDWNRYRKQKGFPNKIEIIELRTDERYGKFFEHKPARAKVEIKRTGGKIKIRIADFISPTILERLQQQAGVLSPKIEDWRSMVDSVMIDTAYDGKVFNVAHSDVPERKNDLVLGEYELAAPKKKTTVAAKITDMLGEEVLETCSV